MILNKKAFTHAKKLVKQGKVIVDTKDEWSEHQPSADKENAFIERQGFDDYGKWYLGLETEEPRDTKGRYTFPYGDFKKVHRGGVIAAQTRAAQYHHADIEQAARQLHEMIDTSKE